MNPQRQNKHKTRCIWTVYGVQTPQINDLQIIKSNKKNPKKKKTKKNTKSIDCVFTKYRQISFTSRRHQEPSSAPKSHGHIQSALPHGGWPPISLFVQYDLDWRRRTHLLFSWSTTFKTKKKRSHFLSPNRFCQNEPQKKKANYKWRSKPLAQIEKGTVNGHTTTGAVTQSVFAQNTSNKNGVRTQSPFTRYPTRCREYANHHKFWFLGKIKTQNHHNGELRSMSFFWGKIPGDDKHTECRS